jgi:hypothetical protein
VSYGRGERDLVVIREYTPQAYDIVVDLKSSVFVAEESQELAESLRAETGLRVESGLFHYYTEGSPLPPPDVIVGILYTLFPLNDIYAGVLSAILWDKVKAALSQREVGCSEVNFRLQKVYEDGRILKEVRKEVRVVTSDREIIRDMIRQVDE